MALPNKVYDVLKWVVILVIPATAIFYKNLATTWGWAFVEEIPATLYGLETFLGAILGVSTMNYENKKKEELRQAKVLNGQEDADEK